MSKVMYICNRNGNFDMRTENKLVDICNQLTPDNIRSDAHHRIMVQNAIAYAVTLPNTALHESELNLLLGVLYGEESKNWKQPMTPPPDGNYVIIRNNENLIEVVSDPIASKTIWYYHDKEVFIASTSQRAIILFLGTFHLNRSVIPWMLSTGTLGPKDSWDERLARLQPDSTLVLDKNNWKISVRQNPITFVAKKYPKEEHRDKLYGAIRQTIRSLRSIDLQHWVLSLSGGYDSRAILCFLRENMEASEDFRTITWGLRSSIHEDGNDAKIAIDLARSFRVRHEYYPTDISPEPMETILDRFILSSEGRIDHIAGYMDGMEIWRMFHDDLKITGVIRGDEGFGWMKSYSPLSVRQRLNLTLCSDYVNLQNVIRDFRLPIQKIPSEFEKQPNETLAAWRDRLYHSYRLPTTLAALSDIKFSYIEQINPLLSKAILNTVRQLPDNLRSNKKLYKEIVAAVGPDIPIATKGANAKIHDLLYKKALVDIMRNELKTDYAHKLFDHDFVQYFLNGIKDTRDGKNTNKKSIAALLKGVLRLAILRVFKREVIDESVDGNVLGLRVFIILKMVNILEQDAVKITG